MRYLINSMVVFNPADYTLISNDKSVDMLTLSRISGELLQLFIIHNDAPLSRDAILFELWEKRGLNASSNNLNNYVSMLRKALMQCGCEGLITTIPKHGFIFSADVTVQPPAEVDTGLPADIMPELNHVPPVMPRKNIIRTGGIILLSLVVAFFIAALSYQTYDYYRLASIRTELFRSDQCRFWLIDDVTRRKAPDQAIARIKNIVKEEKINCRLPVNVYFSSDRLMDSRGVAVVNEMFSYCAYNSKAPCDNFIFSRYEGQND